MSELLNKTIENIKPLNNEAAKKAEARQNNLTKPQGSLGRLENIAIQLAAIQGKEKPAIKEKAILTLAGDHGVIEEGIVDWPQEVTAQMVLNFLGEGAAINVLTKHVGARVTVVDVGVATDIPNHSKLVVKRVANGTKNMAKGPAMTREEAIKAIEAGIEAVNEEVQKGLDIVGTGDMGICNTTPSAAICAVITGKPVKDVTGRGTGIDDDRLMHKVQVIEKAIEKNKPNPKDALDVLEKVGGFEIAGIAGVIIGAAANGIPVVIDGFISGAGALIATELVPQAKDYIIAGHRSQEPGHRVMLDHMGLEPVLDLDMRLGEGTGAALSFSLIEASVKILSDMATFGEAGVSEKE